MLEIGIEQLQLRFGAETAGDLAAHRDQARRAAGRHIHPPQHLLARRIGGVGQGGRGRRGAVGKIALRRILQRRRVGLERARQIALKAVPAGGIERAHGLLQLARDQGARRFAALGQQCRGELPRFVE
ncbi:hypothetical protein ACVMFB_006297 [Bradyrhizobium sp. USDA 4522]